MTAPLLAYLVTRGAARKPPAYAGAPRATGDKASQPPGRAQHQRIARHHTRGVVMSGIDLSNPETEPVVSRAKVAAFVVVVLNVAAGLGLHLVIPDVWVTIATVVVNLVVLGVTAWRTRQAVFSPATVASTLVARDGRV